MRWKRLKGALALVGGIGLLVFLLAYAGPDRLADAFAHASPALVAAAAAAYGLFFILRGIRWRSLLASAAPSVGVASTTSLSAFGWLVSTFIPLKAGDAARAALLARRQRASLAAVAGTVVVERGLDVIGLAATASAGLLAIHLASPGLLPGTVARAVAVAWVLPLLGLLVLAFMARRVSPERVRPRFLAGPLHRFLAAARWLGDHPRQVPLFFALSLLIVAVQASVFVFLFLAFQPDAPIATVAAGAPLFLLSFVIAVTPGHIGTYEAAFVAVYGLFGFDRALLAAMAILIHILTAAIVSVWGSAGAVAYRWSPAPASPMATPKPGAGP